MNSEVSEAANDTKVSFKIFIPLKILQMLHNYRKFKLKRKVEENKNICSIISQFSWPTVKI